MSRSKHILFLASLVALAACGSITTNDVDAGDTPDAQEGTPAARPPSPDARPPECTGPLECDDGDACTDDACNAAGMCENTPVNETGSVSFNYSGGIETFTVPLCSTRLIIEARGAQGGGGPTVEGGLGARMRGEFADLQGQDLLILVGGRGVDASNDNSQGGGSGGGGSFVATSDTQPLIVAGGGGGALYSLTGVGNEPRELNGGPGQITPEGQAGDGGGAGGTNGEGGQTWPWTGWHSGTGGGGFFGNGDNPSNGSSGFGTPNQPGIGFVNGGLGGTAGSEGRPGGFGGGGAAGFTGGGGGGYSGGGSSTYGDQTPGANTHGGGGGGSYNSGSNQDNEPGVQAGDGQVILTW